MGHKQVALASILMFQKNKGTDPCIENLESVPLKRLLSGED
jgi:hypothetical protein